MNVLMVTSECFPLVKTGGLAGVVGALSGALQVCACYVWVMLPNYRAVATQLREPCVIGVVDDLFGADALPTLLGRGGQLALLGKGAPDQSRPRRRADCL